MTTIGFIGSGHIGSTLARLAVGAGHDVVLSNSRGPETLQDLVDDLGPRARAGDAEEAAQTGDLVVVTIPLLAVEQVPTAPLAGKVVIDTSNYYPQRDGQIAALDDRSQTTSELVQSLLPESRVVKAFNNINFLHLGTLQRPTGSTERTVLPIAGDAEAKAAVTAFIDSLGYDVYDAGSLADSWRFDVGTPAYGRPYNTDTSGAFPPPADSGRQATADAIRDALAAAER
jgi:predicted dinucleotide-binding enzyme